MLADFETMKRVLEKEIKDPKAWARERGLDFSVIVEACRMIDASPLYEARLVYAFIFGYEMCKEQEAGNDA